MKLKSLFISTIILILGIFASGCSGSQSLPVVIPLEESVKEIIISKGDNYDFLEDELYNIKIEELIQSILSKLKSYNITYTVGNLDEDNIPEIAVFIERKPEDTQDQGSLQIYKFNGEGYALIDEIAMNYDNNNYAIEIGKISQNQNGLFLNNQVGAHSAITYGFILEDGKLKSILNDKKLNLLSVYTSNEIADIDQDGILEFSIFTIDPETVEQSAVGSDKITLWYKWDGIDGGILTQVERDIPNLGSDSKIFRSIKSLIPSNQQKALNELIKNQSKLSYIDNTLLLQDYIEVLEGGLAGRNQKIQELFSNYQSGYLLNEYGLSIERLNELEYLNRDKTLVNELELKNLLIMNLNLGLKLKSSTGKYFYDVDYRILNDKLGESISKEYRDYLNILALDTNEPYAIGDSLLIGLEKLGDRITILEKFIITYPYSSFIPEVEHIYKSYKKAFIFGDIYNPHFHEDSHIIKDEVLNHWQHFIQTYPNSYFSDRLSGLLEDIIKNQNILKDEILSDYKHLY